MGFEKSLDEVSQVCFMDLSGTPGIYYTDGFTTQIPV